jgi:ATP-dependent RNA helicase DDX1
MSLGQCRFFVLDEADGLLKAGYEQLITRLHGQIPKMTSDGTRLQMIVCSATLHDFDVKRMAERLMHFPTWVDLKGQVSRHIIYLLLVGSPTAVPLDSI